MISHAVPSAAASSGACHAPTSPKRGSARRWALAAADSGEDREKERQPQHQREDFHQEPFV